METAKAEKPAAADVLVIDDDAAVLDSLALLLGSHGLRIATARDGVEGLALFHKLMPKVVLTDILMPEDDGIGTIRAIRRVSPSAKIIAMSGSDAGGKVDYLAMAQKLGADAAFYKSLRVEEIVALLHTFLA